MTLRRLKEKQEDIKWPARPDKLPLVSWETFQREAKKNSLILINGYIHDASEFENKHPGGKAIIRARVGKDATAAFGGGVYEHSNAAHNVSHYLILFVDDVGMGANIMCSCSR